MGDTIQHWGSNPCSVTTSCVIFNKSHELSSFINKTEGFSKQEPKGGKGASLVAQWLRICLLMQETRVRALVWEDPTCHGAAGPVSHSC